MNRRIENFIVLTLQARSAIPGHPFSPPPMVYRVARISSLSMAHGLSRALGLLKLVAAHGKSGVAPVRAIPESPSGPRVHESRPVRVVRRTSRVQPLQACVPDVIPGAVARIDLFGSGAAVNSRTPGSFLPVQGPSRRQVLHWRSPRK